MAYFANGSKGAILDNQCDNCKFGQAIDNGGCPIRFVQEWFNYDAVNNETATQILDSLIDPEGNCIMLKRYKNSLEIENGWDCK